MASINFQSFEINNGRVFDQASIPLSKQGLVSIQGPIGSGKSTIWALMEAVMFGSTPSKHKKHDLVADDKPASFNLEFEKDKKHHKITFYREKRSWKYAIEVEGESKTPHSVVDGPKKIMQLIELTQDEFEGSIHLTQNSSHVLISGKPSQRKDYISNFFNLDHRYDLIKNECDKQLKAVQDRINQLSGLSHNRQYLLSEFESLEFQSETSIEKRLEQEQYIEGNLKKDLAYQNDQMRYALLYKQYEEQARSYSNPKKSMEDVNNKISDYKNQIKDAANIKSRNQRAKQVNENIKKLEEYKSYVVSSHPEVPSADYAELEKEYNDLKYAIQQNKQFSPLIQELDSLPDEGASVDVKNLNQQYTEMHSSYQTHLRRNEAIASGKCPECGSEFEASEREKEKDLVQKLYNQLIELHATIEEQTKRNQRIQRRNYLISTLKDVKQCSKDDLQRYYYLEGLLNIKKKYDETVHSLSLLEPEMYEPVPDEDYLNKEIENLKSTKRMIQACLDARSHIQIDVPLEFDEEEMKVMINQTTERIRVKKDLISELQKEIGVVKTNNTRYESLKEQLRSIDKQLEDLERLKEEEFFWQKMVEAYGPKGIRIEQLKKKMDLVIKRLPIYTNVLFAEKGLTFTHSCDATNIQITARRKKKLADGSYQYFEHDISSFSGGEKSLMSVAFVVSLADCVPKNKRSNLVILDEIDSALDQEGRYRFTNELLPMLKRNYDSIYVISHSSEIQQATMYDQIWSIKKENHRSTITKQKSVENTWSD